MRWLFIVCCLTAFADTGTVPAPAGDVYRIDLSCLIAPIVKLSQHPEIRRQVERYNQQSRPEPASLDEDWPYLPESSPLLRAVLDNPAAPLLQRFIKLISLRGEGLVIGADGGLVAATNHTSDFWQGDEAQFQRVMTAANLQPQIIEAYYDESTEVMLVKMAAPITGVDDARIGVLVIGFDVKVMEFRRLCAQIDG